MVNNSVTIDIIASLFAQAVQKTLEKSTKKSVKYSKTFMSIPKVCLKPEVGSFVQFSGDYSGLVIINFSAGAALNLYTSYMTTMGLPESELAKESTSGDVVDTIGELTNQIMGRCMRNVESKFDLTSSCGQPKALALNSAITLTPDLIDSDNRRIAFSIGTDRFHLEVAVEKVEFVAMRE